ncbi:hypothetical protein AVEN_135066-1 [Araneus ventricosus]|uniref:Uncharacterized protein n=1 Tax=Araneus ventricosus TaxID=182803 RepID=A0A4Y2CY22_ARAVE|nr:hypothetical protein AVEN_135066-1 [Araneus ventricosus]
MAPLGYSPISPLDKTACLSMGSLPGQGNTKTQKCYKLDRCDLAYCSVSKYESEFWPNPSSGGLSVSMLTHQVGQREGGQCQEVCAIFFLRFYEAKHKKGRDVEIGGKNIPAVFMIVSVIVEIYMINTFVRYVGFVPVTPRWRSDAHAVTLLDVTEGKRSERDRQVSNRRVRLSLAHARFSKSSN